MPFIQTNLAVLYLVVSEVVLLLVSQLTQQLISIRIIFKSFFQFFVGKLIDYAVSKRFHIVFVHSVLQKFER